MLVDQYGKEVSKTVLTDTNGLGTYTASGKPRRGAMIYTLAQLQQMTGRDKEGRLVSWGVERPYFYLSLDQRIEISRLCSPVLGVVTSRMHRLSGLKLNITTEKFKEDKIAAEMKDWYAIYQEQNTDISGITVRARIYAALKQRLPDLRPDLSNFNPSLLRWKRRISSTAKDFCKEALDWLMEPNAGVWWGSFVKKWVYDMMVHGAAAIYKQALNKRLQNFDILPGGSTYKVKAAFFSGVEAYIQIMPTLGVNSYTEPQVYGPDELAYSEYIPNSSRNYGFIPLEALINKIAETLLFDELMANQADGTKPPEKLVIITENNPFGSFDANGSDNSNIPLSKAKQSAIEDKLNTPVKNRIMTFSGNNAKVIDLSRENTMPIQMQRQKDIREEVALVYNMSNMEINLTGSDNTSGRNTSEAQSDIEQGKGVAPLAQELLTVLRFGILSMRYGAGLEPEFEKAKNEMEEKQKDLITLQTGEYTKNEIRDKYNKEGFGEEYDKPDGSAGSGAPGGSSINPMYTRNLE